MPKQIKKFLKTFIKVKKINEEKATLEAIFSTDSEDRHGDRVMQNFDLKKYKKNPVILNSHTHGDATEVIGKAEKISVKDGKLQGKIKFAVEENPKAKIIFDLFAGGFLNAFSIGFIPLKFDPKDFSKILKSELLEISAVSVPANGEALAKAKAKGIDVDKLYGDNKSNKKTSKDEKNDGKKHSKHSDHSKGSGEKSKSKDKKHKKQIDIPEKKEKTKAEIIMDGINKYKDQKNNSLIKILNAIKFVSENIKAETRPMDAIAENNRMINKAIRNLIKLKE